MLNEIDKLHARFSPNDRVSFKYRRGTIKGVLIRTNPKRAVVDVNKKVHHVPYELLSPLGDVDPSREAKLETTQQLALHFMHTHKLKGWTFKFDHSTRRAGCCNYRTKTLSISFDLARNAPSENIRDTILHEIAHALVGKKHNHNAVWRAKANEIGGTGERTHKLVFSSPRYHVACENRCWKHTAERRNRRLICGTCGGKLLYTLYTAPAGNPYRMAY